MTIAETVHLQRQHACSQIHISNVLNARPLRLKISFKVDAAFPEEEVWAIC